jgi:hypothetical protein
MWSATNPRNSSLTSGPQRAEWQEAQRVSPAGDCLPLAKTSVRHWAQCCLTISVSADARPGEILKNMEEGSLEFWDWFYEPSMNNSASIEERWQPDLVVHQTPELIGTAGTFHGYEGLRQVNLELIEQMEEMRFRVRDAQELGEGRWLVLLTMTGRGRSSGLPVEDEVGHIITMREGRGQQLDIYRGWDVAREAAGLK